MAKLFLNLPAIGMKVLQCANLHSNRARTVSSHLDFIAPIRVHLIFFYAGQGIVLLCIASSSALRVLSLCCSTILDKSSREVL